MYINTIEAIKSHSNLEGLISPYYEKYSIVNAASFILKNFGITPVHDEIPELTQIFSHKEKVILLLIDALGLKLLNYTMKNYKVNAFEKLKENGILLPLTSVFPSTTAVALPSLSTGLTPGEHGLLGYRFFSQEYGFLLNSLFGKPANTNHCKLHIDINWYLPESTIGEKLAKEGIKSYIVTNASYLNSHFEKALYRGFNEIPYLTSSDMFFHIVKLIKEDNAPKFIFGYWWAIDALSHRYGPYSQPVMNEIVQLNTMIGHLIDSIDSNTLLLITADHGQIFSPPEENIDLSNIPEISRHLLTPLSDLRAPYIYSKASDILQSVLEKLPNVVTFEKEEAIKARLFGNNRIKEEFKSRIGDFVLIIKNNKNYSYLSPPEEINLKGKHGGLSEEEMLVPLFAYTPRGM